MPSLLCQLPSVNIKEGDMWIAAACDFGGNGGKVVPVDSVREEFVA